MIEPQTPSAMSQNKEC